MNKLAEPVMAGIMESRAFQQLVPVIGAILFHDDRSGLSEEELKNEQEIIEFNDDISHMRQPPDPLSQERIAFDRRQQQVRVHQEEEAKRQAELYRDQYPVLEDEVMSDDGGDDGGDVVGDVVGEDEQALLNDDERREIVDRIEPNQNEEEHRSFVDRLVQYGNQIGGRNFAAAIGGIPTETIKQMYDYWLEETEDPFTHIKDDKQAEEVRNYGTDENSKIIPVHLLADRPIPSHCRRVFIYDDQKKAVRSVLLCEDEYGVRKYYNR